jgi:hypothetical protein
VTSEVDKNNISASNHEVDDWDDDWEEPDFEVLEALDKEYKVVNKEQKVVIEEQKKLWKILFANRNK